jgi:ribonuclease D
MFPKEITKEQINELPLGQYDGPVEIIVEDDHLEGVVEELHEQPILGFDTETRPSFRKGEKYPVALLQLAVPHKVYLIRISHTTFTSDLASLFERPDLKKVGISIKDDIRDLQLLNEFNPAGVVELNNVASKLEINHAGVRRLSAIFLGMRVSKSQQTSNWANPEYSEKQIRYAATDAWVCLEIYNKLQNKGLVDPNTGLIY